jgi:hypothetical protein
MRTYVLARVRLSGCADAGSPSGGAWWRLWLIGSAMERAYPERCHVRPRGAPRLLELPEAYGGPPGGLPGGRGGRGDPA